MTVAEKTEKRSIGDYPEILTNKNWQKMKGAIAKMAGETGVGKAMDAVEAAWKRVPWALFDPEKAWAGVGVKKLDDYYDAFKKAKDRFPEVEKVRKALFDLEKLAEKTAADWAKNKLIPKASAEHAKKVAAEASRLATELKSLDQVFIEAKRKYLYDNVVWSILGGKRKLDHQEEEGKGSLEKMKQFLKEIDIFEKSPTAATLLKLFSGDSNARGVTTFCKFWDQAIRAIFGKIATSIYKGEMTKEYLPYFSDYGANRDSNAWRKMLEDEAKVRGSVEATLLYRAQELAKAKPKLQEIIKYAEALAKAAKEEMAKVP